MVVGTPQPDLVRVGAIAHETHLSHVRPGAAVWAAGHADDERVLEADLCEERAEPRVHLRQAPLGLCHRQTAQRQRRARHAAGEEGVLLRVPRRCELRLDVIAVLWAHLAQDEVLLRGQHHAQLVLFDDLSKRLLPNALQPAILHKHAAIELAVSLLSPPEVVDVLPLGKGLEGLHLLPQVLLHDAPEFIDAPRMHEVFEAGHLPVIASSVVPLRRDDRLHDVEDVVLVDVPEGLGQGREGVGVAVRAAHAAPDKHVESLEFLCDRVAHHHHHGIVRERVDGVVARDGHGNLELSR